MVIAKTKVQLPLSQGKKMKEVEVEDGDDDDDDVRTSVSQDRAIATLCTEVLFPFTQYTYIALSTYQTGKTWGGRGYRRSTQHISKASWIPHLPAGPHHEFQSFQSG